VGPRTRPSLTPHLTFLYGDHRVPDLDIDLISWTVREFVLGRSVHGQSRHMQLGRWPLRPTS
jgi:2'-5' RNA ligase